MNSSFNWFSQNKYNEICKLIAWNSNCTPKRLKTQENFTKDTRPVGREVDLYRLITFFGIPKFRSKPSNFWGLVYGRSVLNRPEKSWMSLIRIHLYGNTVYFQLWFCQPIPHVIGTVHFSTIETRFLHIKARVAALNLNTAYLDAYTSVLHAN